MLRNALPEIARQTGHEPLQVTVSTSHQNVRESVLDELLGEIARSVGHHTRQI